MPYALTGAVLERSGRRPTLGATFGQSGLCCLALACLGAGGPQGKALALVSKAGVTLAYSTVFVFGSELFPTEVRSLALGTGNVASRFGGFLAPFAVNLLAGGAAPLAFGCAALAAAGVVVAALPETKGRDLPGSAGGGGVGASSSSSSSSADDTAASAQKRGEGAKSPLLEAM